MLMRNCDFTYSHYEKILELIKSTDYRVKFFNESCLTNEKEIILRHDVDVDLERAYKMALIEKKYGIKSSYFILIRSPFYNIFDKSGSDFIRGIIELGHQIGLHFDEAYYYLNNNENIKENVDKEVQILRESFDIDIFAVSFHRPSKYILQSDIKLNNNLINTYDSNYIREFKYISDSRRMWKEGCLCNILKKSYNQNIDHERIHTLIHPIWWTDKSMNSQDTLEKYLINKLKFLDCELEKNIQIYKRLL